VNQSFTPAAIATCYSFLTNTTERQHFHTNEKRHENGHLGNGHIHGKNPAYKWGFRSNFLQYVFYLNASLLSYYLLSNICPIQLQ